jgi:hypothetical protein
MPQIPGADAGKDEWAKYDQEMQKYQEGMQAYNRAMTMLTQMQQMRHETSKAIIQNFRV